MLRTVLAVVPKAILWEGRVLNLQPTQKLVSFDLPWGLASKTLSRCGVPLRLDSPIWVNVWGIKGVWNGTICLCICLRLSKWIKSNSFPGLTFLVVTIVSWMRQIYTQLWHLIFELHQCLKWYIGFLCKSCLGVFYHEGCILKTCITEYFRIILSLLIHFIEKIFCFDRKVFH